MAMIRIAARNDKGYGPATQVRYSFPALAFSEKLKSFPHVLLPRWLQDANSPALSGKVGVKRAASVGGQQFAKVALPCPKSRKFSQLWYFQVAKTGVWSHGLEDPEKIIGLVRPWKSWENYCLENPAKITILAEPGILFAPPASLLTILRFCMTTVSLNISQLHLWPFDAKSDL